MREDPRPYFDLFNYVPHAGQAKVHNAWRKRFRVLACGVRYGKTKSSASEVIAAMLSPSGVGERKVYWCVAPTAELSMRVFVVVRDTLLNYFQPLILDNRDRDRLIRIRNFGGGTSEVVGKTAESLESLLGEGVSGMVIDEASRALEKTWQSYLLPRLLDKRGWCLFPSTPKGKGLFYDLYNKAGKGEEDWASFSGPSWENPIISKEEIDREYLGKVPERIYRQEFLAQFIEGGGSVFVNVGELATGELEDGPTPGEAYYMGADFARHGDFTVLTVVAQDGRVVHTERHHKIPWPEQEKIVQEVYETWNGPTLTIDASGVGDPIYEHLLQMGVAAEPYVFSNKSKGELIDNLVILMERGALTLPTKEECPEMIDELSRYEYNVTDFKNIQMGAPSGHNDDEVIALGLACFPLATRTERMQRAEPEKIVATWADEKASMLRERNIGPWERRGFFAGRPHPWLRGA